MTRLPRSNDGCHHSWSAASGLVSILTITLFKAIYKKKKKRQSTRFLLTVPFREAITYNNLIIIYNNLTHIASHWERYLGPVFSPLYHDALRKLSLGQQGASALTPGRLNGYSEAMF